MANYHVYVKNYHWSHQNTIVQSPVLDLGAPVSSLIVRPLEGTNKNEPRIICNVTDLKDDIQENEYQTEAHGLFVSTGSQRQDFFPIWVPIHNYKCRDGEIYGVNLIASEACKASIADVCWVPGYEAPSGDLYTVIGAPRMTIRETRVLVLAQQFGSPRKAKLALFDPSLLAGFEEIDDARKKKVFEIQLRALRVGRHSTSSPLLNTYRLYMSSYRNENGRRPLEEVLRDEFEPYRPSDSDGSRRTKLDNSRDDDSLYARPSYVSLAKVPNVSSPCYIQLR
ncbi:uncharacterized protein F4822DRAFT_133023 [Hypoxylon trugodes]|uniref:uncharacterized protein n=1 Tax=Hypoxylon trugodes TaxID=326681 RepID=UPI00219D00FD|nr:uncharacterized protein F4822DRAFT_133023 [Hypoxylon trugodes]KAI1392574.1 hypothetical protein F4822DRAFT_133023 [Hypoxylon trugodes]